MRKYVTSQKISEEIWINDLIASANVKQACQFIGLASYYRRYIYCDKFQKRLQCCAEGLFDSCIYNETYQLYRIPFYSANWPYSIAMEWIFVKQEYGFTIMKHVSLILLIIIDALSRLFHTNTIHCVFTMTSVCLYKQHIKEEQKREIPIRAIFLVITYTKLYAYIAKVALPTTMVTIIII